jgi:hypothetical protein
MLVNEKTLLVRYQPEQRAFIPICGKKWKAFGAACGKKGGKGRLLLAQKMTRRDKLRLGERVNALGAVANRPARRLRQICRKLAKKRVIGRELASHE